MNGRVVASERPGHTILEGQLRSQLYLRNVVLIQLSVTVPNPIGVVGVLTAFNFPVAVYGWYDFLWLAGHLHSVIECRNFSLSLAAGNANVWKPSPSTPLCSIAVTKIIAGVLEKNGIPGAVSTLITGGKDIGEAIVESRDIPLGETSYLNGAGCLLNRNDISFIYR